MFRSILALNVIPSITQGAFALLIVSVVVRVLHLQNNRLKIYLYGIPTLRSLIVFVVGVPLLSSPSSPATIISGFWMPDPMQMIKIQMEYARDLHVSTSQEIFLFVFFLSLIIIALLLASRWVRLMLFYTRLFREKDANRKTYKATYTVLEKLATRAGMSMPRLIVSDKCLVPFTIGHKLSTIVLPEKVLRACNLEQLEAILAHELAHIKRGDYLYQWVYLLARDLLFFNPALRFCLRKMGSLTEFVCDEMALSLIQRPRALAEGLVVISESLEGLPPSERRRVLLAKSLLGGRELMDRVLHISSFPARKWEVRRRGRIQRKAVFALLYLVAVYIYFTATIYLGNLVLSV